MFYRIPNILNISGCYAGLKSTSIRKEIIGTYLPLINQINLHELLVLGSKLKRERRTFLSDQLK